jgi:hypothetical protein
VTQKLSTHKCVATPWRSTLNFASVLIAFDLKQGEHGTTTQILNNEVTNIVHYK